jgi:hypothetical protein
MIDSSRIEELTVVARGLGFEVICHGGALPVDPEAPLGGRLHGKHAAFLVDLPRDRRQAMVMAWAELAFGREEATGLPQRGLRLLEEAIEVFQACGGAVEIAHELVTAMFGRPCGTIGQELGGVAVSLLALAAASGLSADMEECRELHRVLSKPVEEFSRRNATKIKITPVPTRRVL